MINRIIVAVALTLAGALLTWQVWVFLNDTKHARIALVVETESYAVRSKLVRSFDSTLQTIRAIDDYWVESGPREEVGLPAFEHAEFGEIPWLEAIVWVDRSSGRQFISTPGQPAPGERRGDAVWNGYDAVLAEAGAVQGEAVIGPVAGESGYRFHVVTNRPWAGGLLVATFDATAALADFLQDESPGYAITVAANGHPIHVRGEAAANVPDDWIRGGAIRTSMDTVLAVEHAPTEELLRSLSTPALSAVLPLGLAVSALIGLLVFENGRVNLRARAARRAEQQIAALNRGLEQQIAERTEELANRNADMETITASVAHDLRNPLNAVSANLQVLEQEAGATLKTETRDAMRRAVASVSRMGGIVDRLIEWSTAAHSTFARQPLSMTVLVAEEFDRLRSMESFNDVAFDLDQLARVEADETLVRILVLNLLSNALQSTRDQPNPRISVSSAQDTGVAVFCIRDSGRGLDRESARRIFEPFETSSEDGHANGLGLGLTIATRVVRRHGGRIWADGIAGQEASIYFTLAPDTDDQ